MGVDDKGDGETVLDTLLLSKSAFIVDEESTTSCLICKGLEFNTNSSGSIIYK